MKGLPITREQADANNARVNAEAALFAKLTPEERKNYMASKRAGKPRIIVDPVHVPSPPEIPVSPALKNPREMNKTERAFSDLLEARKRKGEIQEWRYEGVRLKWGGNMHYCADFFVREQWGKNPTLFEVKGAHIFDRDIIRFKGCREEWKHDFSFEMHQYKNSTWTRIH